MEAFQGNGFAGFMVSAKRKNRNHLNCNIQRS